jgi:nitrilase
MGLSEGAAAGDAIKVGLAQIAPVWLDRGATLEKVASFVSDAGSAGCDLVTFGEGLVPGYPFWIERTDGARFDSPPRRRCSPAIWIRAL